MGNYCPDSCRRDRSGHLPADARKKTGCRYRRAAGLFQNQHTERKRADRPRTGIERRHFHNRHPASGRRSRPDVRNIRQNRADQFYRRNRRAQRRSAGQSERQAASGPAIEIRSPIEAGRRPRVPSERTARKGRRQPGSLRTGAHRTGDPERRHRPGQSQYRPDRTARAVRRDHRAAPRQRGGLRFAVGSCGQTDQDFSAENRIFGTRTIRVRDP